MNEFLILYILKIKSFNIYEIKKYVDTNFAPFLSLSTGALIPALKRLENAGCVVAEKLISDGGMRRSVYSITQNGEAFINEYLSKDIEGAPQLARREIEILMLLLNSETLSDEQKSLLRAKLISALNENIKIIVNSIKYSKIDTEVLNIELIYQEAKLRMLSE